VLEHNRIINIISGGVTGAVTCLLDLYSVIIIINRGFTRAVTCLLDLYGIIMNINIANIIRAITIAIVSGCVN
jgi:hypothetical protein